MGELVFKIAATVVLIIIPLYCILWLWGEQIVPGQTLRNIVKVILPIKRDVIATRDPKKIYQDGKEVGNITGKVISADNCIIFEEVCDTGKLNIGEPFEYKRYTVKVTHIDEVIGIKMGMPTKKDVKRGMKCIVLK